jgi:branched-chain amino acid transport system substrate-binding protein
MPETNTGGMPMRLRFTTTALTLMLAGASSFASAEIRIGASLAETGPASFLGDPEAKTLRMYVDKLNEAGGLLGEQVELIVYDDGGDPNKARTFATRLVEDDEVVAVVGGSTTGASMAMITVFEEAGIPYISIAGGIEIVDPVKKWVFKTPHTDRMVCAKIFEEMKAKGISRIGLISGTDGFGASMRKQCLALVGDYGIAVVADEGYSPDDVDMTPQLTNIRNAPGLQAVIDTGFGESAVIVTRNYSQLGIKVPLYQSHGVASQSYIDLSGEAAEGVRLPASALLVADKLAADDPQRDVVVGYKSTYEAATGEPVSTFGGHAYDGLQILVEAIARAGSTDPDAIRDAIEQTEGFVGTTGVVNMSPEDHLGLDLSALRMVEIRDGEWTLAQ